MELVSNDLINIMSKKRHQNFLSEDNKIYEVLEHRVEYRAILMWEETCSVNLETTPSIGVSTVSNRVKTLIHSLCVQKFIHKNNIGYA